MRRWNALDPSSECGHIHLTGLQPPDGAYPSLEEALVAFLRSSEGWHRHVDGIIVLHETDCSFFDDDEDRCCCAPTIIPRGTKRLQ